MNFLTISILVKLLLGANLLVLVGPNKTIIRVLDKLIMCIIPLSIVIAVSSREARAVTKAGQERFVFNSGNKAVGT